MSVASARAQADSWGSPSASTPPTVLQRRPLQPATAIRDDWDDEHEEVDTREDPQKLWEDANQRAPMPELVIAHSSTHGPSAASPPPAAFQPVLRILKRPTSGSGSPVPSPASSSSGSPAPDNSYAAREARYQAARERIFGDASPGASTPNLQTSPAPSSASTSTAPRSPPLGGGPPQIRGAPPAVQIAREPRGPPVNSASPDSGQGQGFGGRRSRRRGGGKGAGGQT
ncbi:uncharacterized protein BXZ73DRAFT_100029 [Epithele typhae]|uniref:uncharacterized protein n=1 Tax=Epithele typhae TaxID=378194 RepID=UPI00200749A4|nr:uncharacterized protein BXZ73DRAFT_100029 [Epithele typhae]KAH9937815.1 hypothetical protein BXZ73DRAFT_100029 [Epithele typhae]